MHDSPFRSLHRKVTLASLGVVTVLAASALAATPALAGSVATPVAPPRTAVDHHTNNGWD
ncbi:hypothetical protein [Streptomyces sp. NPDC004579]|uniref:hypothetical protein n=1 Tax=Streptomyces sp. NPDC004579 TaxID=3154667 RepID=UPI0033A0EC8D